MLRMKGCLSNAWFSYTRRSKRVQSGGIETGLGTGAVGVKAFPGNILKFHVKISEF